MAEPVDESQTVGTGQYAPVEAVHALRAVGLDLEAVGWLSTEGKMRRRWPKWDSHPERWFRVYVVVSASGRTVQ